MVLRVSQIVIIPYTTAGIYFFLNQKTQTTSYQIIYVSLEL